MDSIGSIQVIFWSKNRGQGKTVALCSYYREGLEKTRKLILDKEYRSRTYRSANGNQPEKLLWGFDYFHEAYGDLDPDTFKQLYLDIKSGEVAYDTVLIDNAADMQNDILSWFKALGQGFAREYTKTFGVYYANASFIETRFKATNAGGIYGLAKSIIGAFLVACRKADVDVIISTEAQNKWDNYGSRDAKILGQTGKVLEPFLKYADVVYELSRTVGNREKGTAKLIDVPWVAMDTFNPKCSIPGLAPKFQFTWPEFWQQVGKREVATAAQLAEVKIEAAKEAEEQEETAADAIRDAKDDWLATAQARAIISGKDDSAGIPKLILHLGETYSELLQCQDIDRIKALHAQGLDKIREWEVEAE